MLKKINDINKDKWIGIGGKFEDRESPEECVLREVKEETGLDLISYDYRGIITFVSKEYPTEYMHLFTSSEFTGELKVCDEGVLEWVNKKDVYSLPIWQGDKIFLKMIEEKSHFFSLKLTYSKDTLMSAVLNGKALKLQQPTA